MNKRGICKNCNKEMSIYSKGLCKTCYRKQKEKQECKNCGKIKQIEARGLCGSCWTILKNKNQLNNFELKQTCQNDYIIKDNIVYLKITDTKNNIFYTCFNIWNLDKIKQYKWNINDLGYVISNSVLWSKNIRIKLHKLIINNIEENYVIDHIQDFINDDIFIPKQRNNLDNNLRITTQQKNSWNTTIMKNNKSGYIGVRWNNTYKKWHAYLKYNNKMVLNKKFLNKEDAIIARLKAELEYFGIEFAPQRHLFKEYNILHTNNINNALDNM